MQSLQKARQRSTEQATAVAPKEYLPWLQTLFPTVYTKPLAPYHHEFWQWIWGLNPYESSSGVFIWPRGFSKSTNSERAVIKLATMGFRYALYVKGTQQGADDAVQNIASLLESKEISEYYPRLSERDVTKFGTTKGWRRNRLRTAAGFMVDAAGLDSKVRGLLIEGDRPDVIIVDDVDDTLDSPDVTERKLKKLLHDIFPAGAPNRVIIMVQNLISPHGIFTRLAGINPDFPADFLLDAFISGPHPAIEGLEYTQFTKPDGKPGYRITAGKPSWPEGRPLSVLEAEMNEIGATVFIQEKQNEVMNLRGSLYKNFHLEPIERPALTEFEDIQVWCDPAVTETDQSDSMGIRVGGRRPDGTVIGLYAWEGKTSVDDVMGRAILKAVEYRASVVGAETNQGGDTWGTVFRAVWRDLVESGQIPPGTPKPEFRQVKAPPTTSKRERWLLAKSARERGDFLEAKGTHQVLYRSLQRLPEHRPYDLADCDYWLWDQLQRPKPMHKTTKRPVYHSY